MEQKVTTSSGTAFKTGLFATLGVVMVPIIIVIALLFLCCGCSLFGSMLPTTDSYSTNY